MGLLESASAANGVKRVQRRAYGWPSHHENEQSSSVLEMFPTYLNDYETDEPKDSLFLKSNDEERLSTQIDYESCAEEEEECGEPLIIDSTQADLNGLTSICEDSQYYEQGEEGLNSNCIKDSLAENSTPLISDYTNTQETIYLNNPPAIQENYTSKTQQEEEISSRRRSRRVLDKIMKQEELIERVTKILTETDKVFHQFTPNQRDSVTVRDVVQLIEENLQWSLNKDEKKQVRGRLVELNTALAVLQQDVATGDIVEGSHHELNQQEKDAEMDPIYDNDDSDYDHDDIAPKKKAATSRKQIKDRKVSQKRVSVTSPDGAEKNKKKSKLNPKDFALDHDTEPKDDVASNPYNSSTKKRKQAHLKIHLDMKKKREAKIREEEIALKKKENEKINEKDRVLAQLIARKFETDNEELRIQRTEDRLNLLERLEKRRWGVLRSSCELDGLDVPISLLHVPAKETIQSTESNNQIDQNIIHEKEASCSDDESKDSDEEELEIFHSHGPAPTIIKSIASVPPLPQVKSFLTKQISPKSILDFFVTQKQVHIKKPCDNSKTKGSVSRSALINMLRIKQTQAGNKWLARELGHENPEDHIRECMNAMKEKRNVILKIEEGRRSVAAERKQIMQQILEEQDNVTGKLDSQDSAPQKRSLLSDENNLDMPEFENIDDDEFALARKLEREQENSSDYVNDQEDVDDNSEYLAGDDNIDAFSQKYVGESLQEENDESRLQYKHHDFSGSDDLVQDYTQDFSLKNGEERVTHNMQGLTQHPRVDSNIPALNDSVQVGGAATYSTISSKEEEEREFDEVLVTSKDTKKGKKNSAWKAMLLKEEEQAKKQRKMRAVRDGLVEAEAEEEEEEEGIAGLEDFGFTIGARKKLDDEEEENDEIMDDDFEDIVDELSDNEGDEDAGEKARKAFERKEEKERLKEIKRRVREGYDGRREGIAGGISSARGVHRFDQLVAADNYEEAKRLGLQNDDESENEDDGGNRSRQGEGEIDEDENALIDKAIKERHLKTFDMPETFSDDEDDDEGRDKDDDSEQGDKNSDDEEDREQERLAKRFAKRARMNRLLEMYNSESQFSRSRLLDEDLTLRRDLKAIKNAHAKTSRDVSVGSLFNSVLSSQISLKRTVSMNLRTSSESQQSSTSSVTVGPTITSAGSKLNLSLRLNSNIDRSKTSFLGRAKMMTSMTRNSSTSK